MSAFDFLTEREKEIIKNYIISYGPTIPSRFDSYLVQDLSVILKEWDINKSKDLFTLFGGENLILTRPYSYLAQTEALSQKIEEAYRDAAPQAFESWYTKMIHTAGNSITVTDMQGNDLKEKNWWYTPWYALNECKTSMALAANAYLGDDCIIKFPSGKQMKLFRGMKPMKIFHRVIEEFNGPEDIFDAYRTWHSMQLNQKRMDGELCLSIHPLDYMTMSDNDNGWKSCMRWTDPVGESDHGDFRSGTVQCLNSPYIIVAYLHNPDHKFYPFHYDKDLSWNSKQWRELFIVQDGVINEIKGYPFQDENLTNTCLMWLKELAAKNLGWTYENEEVDVGKEIPTEDPHSTIYLTYNSGNYMYKDIGSIQKHRGRINRAKLLMPDKYLIQDTVDTTNTYTSHFITIYYGGKGTCMCCGNVLPYERSERVMCDACDTVQICSCCGEPIYDDNYYWVDERDEPICESCWEEECCYDDFNNDECHLTNNMTDIWLLLGYDESDRPIFHERAAMTYEPEYINSNFRNVFPNGYSTMTYSEGWYNGTRNYVTIEDADRTYMSDVYNAFDIYPHDFDKVYAMAIDNYNLFYDYNHNPLFKEDDDE